MRNKAEFGRYLHGPHLRGGAYILKQVIMQGLYQEQMRQVKSGVEAGFSWVRDLSRIPPPKIHLDCHSQIPLLPCGHGGFQLSLLCPPESSMVT